MSYFRNKKIIFLTKTSWDYYLHPYRTLYAKELINYKSRLYWINQPTRNPAKYLKLLFKKRDSDTKIKIYTPILLTCTNEDLSLVNSFILRIQLFFLTGKLGSDTIIWSVYCSHNNVVRYFPLAYKIYWPGDLFDAKKELNSLSIYDIIMPLTEDNFNYIKNIFPNKVFLSTTGCDTSIFSIKKVNSKNIIPEKMIFKDNRTVIGYVGNISYYRLDFSLINLILKFCDNIRLVLIGIRDGLDNTDKSLSELNNYKNFSLIENIDYKDIPYYIYKFDAGLIPYNLNDFNLGTNPNKFYEYSALGKPTFSSEIPSLLKYKPDIIINKSADEWINNLNNFKNIIVNNKRLISISQYASPKDSIHRLSKFIFHNLSS